VRCSKQHSHSITLARSPKLNRSGLQDPVAWQDYRMWQKIRKIRKKTAKMFGVRFRFVRDPILSPASVQSNMR
jgi:hypothetical protein